MHCGQCWLQWIYSWQLGSPYSNSKSLRSRKGKIAAEGARLSQLFDRNTCTAVHTQAEIQIHRVGNVG